MFFYSQILFVFYSIIYQYIIYLLTRCILRVIGIDPGTAICGYGIIDVHGNKLTAVHYGAILTDKSLPAADRLLIIHAQLKSLIEEYQPDTIAVEELFFNKNAKTVIAVGQARGVVLMTGIQQGLQVAEYTPIQVKQAVVGYGRATKEQVTYMVQRLLNIKQKPKPDDVADALAVAICAGHSCSSLYRLK